MKRFSIETVGLFGKYQDASVGKQVVRLGELLQQRGLQTVVDENTAKVLPRTLGPALPLDRIGSAIDLAIVIGGDGTLLHAARSLAEAGVPVIGVNQGRFGFLTDIPLT